MQPLYQGSPSAKCLYRDKTSIKTVAGDHLVVASHQLLRCGHSGAHAETRAGEAGEVGICSGHAVNAVEILVARCWRFLFEVEIVFALKLFLVDVLDKLAIRARLVRATMSESC